MLFDVRIECGIEAAAYSGNAFNANRAVHVLSEHFCYGQPKSDTGLEHVIFPEYVEHKILPGPFDATSAVINIKTHLTVRKAVFPTQTDKTLLGKFERILALHIANHNLHRFLYLPK